MKKNTYKFNLNTMTQNIVVILLIFVFYTLISNYSIGKKEIKTSSIEIYENQTIWQIANEICKKDNDLNIQNVIIDIKKVNNLSNTDIYVGQTLEVPEY